MRTGRQVARELARWTRPDAAGPGPEETMTWCVFEVAAGEVTSIARYEAEEQVPAS